MIKKNYIFIGTNSAGNNAFFVKRKFLKFNKIVKNKKIFNSKFREGRDKNGKLNFLDKKKSLRKIKDKFVFDINSKKNKKIVDLNLLA